jgi:multiple sugar transport system permease protein
VPHVPDPSTVPADAPGSARRFAGRGLNYNARRRRAGYLLVTPALIVMAAVLVFPIAMSIVVSFFETTTSDFGFNEFVGIDNYTKIFADEIFQAAVRHTIYWMVAEVIVVVAASVGVALLLNTNVGRPAIFRIILLVPWALSPVANAVLWKWIYNANYGILNYLLMAFGIVDEPQIWLGDERFALNALLLAEIWKSIPFIALLMLAGMRNVPNILYRAARLDGASTWQTFRHITLPQLRTTILICVVLQSIWALKSFDLIYVLTRGGPIDATTMLNYLSYRISFQFGDIGLGAAVADILFVFMFVLALGYLRFLQSPENRRTA